MRGRDAGRGKGDARRRGHSRSLALYEARAGDGGPPSPVPHPASLVFFGFLGGLTIGVLAWSGALRVSRRELFSASPLRRFAALTYLGGNPSASSARLLRDYVRWETRPALRRRAERLLRWVEGRLEKDRIA